jgi:hypothetical protein
VEGEGISRSAYAVWPIRKDLVVMSSGPTSPGTVSVHRQLLPGLLLWQPSQSMKKLEEGDPALCASFLS